MISIGIFNQKGGVAKTTSTANLAVIFAEEFGLRVLAIDCDPQANLSFYLAGNPSGNDAFADALERGSGFADCFMATEFVKGRRTYRPSVSLIQSSDKVDYVQISDVKPFRDFLSSSAADFDLCLMDCGPQKTSFNVLALSCCEQVLVPLTPMAVGANGLAMVSSFLDDINASGGNAKILGAFLTMYNSRSSLHKIMRETFSENLGSELLGSSISSSIAMQESFSLHCPIYYYQRSHKTCKEYVALAKEILTRLGIDIKKK